METLNITLNGKDVKVFKSSSVQNEPLSYGFEVIVNEVDAGTYWSRIIHQYKYTQMFTSVQESMTIGYKAFRLFRQVDKTTGEVLVENIALFSPASFKVNNDIKVPMDLGNGVEEVGQFRRFMIGAETIGVRFAEHVINGMMEDVSKKAKMLTEENPILINRDNWADKQYVECFDSQYSFYQPVIGKVTNITGTDQSTDNAGNVTSLQNGSVSLLITDYIGSLTYTINNGTSVSTSDNVTISGLNQGDYLITISDSQNKTCKFNITIPINETIENGTI